MFTLRWTNEADAVYRALRARAEESLKSRKAKRKTKSSRAEGLFKQVQKALMSFFGRCLP